MPYRMWYDRTARCVVARMSGEVRLPHVHALLCEEAALAEKNQCTNFLVDLRNTDPRLSTTDASLIPSLATAAGIKLWYREAIVAGSHRADYSGLESASRHQGQDVRVFSTMGEAWTWLHGSHQAAGVAGN